MHTEAFMTALVALLIGGAAIARMIWPGSLLGQILLFSAPAVFLAWQGTHRICERLRRNQSRKA
jgi:membrane protein implicated in regulation of membrane protease activity